MEGIELPRGIRNGNPGNIKLGTQWIGLVPATAQTDPVFCQFTDPKWGIRAIARILKTYERENISTIRDAITRWSATDQDTYVANVAAACQLDPDHVVILSNVLLPMVRAIVQQENGLNNGQPWYADAVLSYGVSLA